MDRCNAVQYNLTCSTKDGRVADWIADQLVKSLGSEAISAVGIAVEPAGRARVLTVIKEPLKHPPFQVLEAAKGLGRRFGVEIVEADIIGEVPLEVLLVCAGYSLSVSKIRPSQIHREEENTK